MRRVLCALLLMTASVRTASAAATFEVTTGADSGPGSLRQAILDVNQATGCLAESPCGITFPLAKSGRPQLVDLQSPLPAVTGQNIRIGPAPDPPYFTSWLVAEIHGQGDGIQVENSTNVRLARLSLIGFPGNGIVVNQSNGVAIESIRLLGNGKNGLLVADSSNVSVRGTISSNGANGIYATRSSGIVVSYSSVGIDSSGAAPNAANGVHFDNVQGSTLQSCVISNNGSNGVLVTGDSRDNNFESTFEHNGLLGIDIGNDGPTPANAPVLSSAEVSYGWTRVKGSVHTSPNSAVHILVYLSDDSDPSGFGEGARTAVVQSGPVRVTTDADGNATFSAFFEDIRPAPHAYASALATGPAGSSEFSNTLPIVKAQQDFVVTTTADSGPGSLRDALERVSDSPDCNRHYPCAIIFHIAEPASPGTGVYTISPRTRLPAITRGTLSVFGSTQRDFAGDTNPFGPEVEINGSQCGACNGLEFRIADLSFTLLSELTINGFAGDGVVAIGENPPNLMFIRIESCYIGSDPTGTRAVPNGRGIDLENTRAYVGEPFGTGNVISGNEGDGIHVAGGDVSIQGNLIGTDRTGTAPLSNGGNGIGSEGAARVQDNSIAFNRGNGIAVLKPALLNPLLENQIYANGALGIDIGGDGKTEDGTFGIVDAPVIVRARSSGNETRVTFTAPSSAFADLTLVTFYASSFADSSGRGEGRMVIWASGIHVTQVPGEHEVIIKGNFAGKFISGVATLYEAYGFDLYPAATTSEFSNALQVTTGDCPTLTPLILSAATTNGNTTFRWSALPGATEYRIWAMAPGDAPKLAYRGTDSQTTQRLAAGSEWWVEARFDPCYGTQSEHRFLQP